MAETPQDRRKTDDWFRTLMEAMHEGLCILDGAGCITYTNPALSAITGYASQDLEGYPITKFFDDTNRTRLLRHLEAHVRGVFDPYEIGFTRKDGRPLVIHVSPRPIPAPPGQFDGSFAVISDITERKHADEEIRKLSTAVEQSPVGILITDTEGNIEYVNRSMCELTGFSAGELIGQNPRLLQSGFTSKKTYHSLWDTLLKGCEWRGELQDKKKSGELYWSYDVISAIKGENGAITHFVALQEDITARKQAEEALRESENKYSLLVENSLTGIYIIQDGYLVYVNGQFAHMLGESKEELVGREFLPFIVPEDREHIAGRMAKILDGRNVLQDGCTRALTKSGKILMLKEGCVCIKYRGRPAILGNIVDITQEKQTEQRLADSTKQLQTLSQQLLNVQELERKRVASELHDGIGQYLNALKFNLQREMSQRFPAGPEPGQVSAYSELMPLLHEAIEEVRRIAADLRPAILDDLGILATINWLCRRVQTLYSQPTVDKQFNIQESDVPERLKTVIFRVVQEAMTNAAKHAKADSVQVRLAKTDDAIELAIADNGAGFDVAQTLANEAPDRGFGLLSMRERVKLSGGRFAIESSGQGTKVVASWPLSTG